MIGPILKIVLEDSAGKRFTVCFVSNQPAGEDTEGSPTSPYDLIVDRDEILKDITRAYVEIQARGRLT